MNMHKVLIGFFFIFYFLFIFLFLFIFFVYMVQCRKDIEVLIGWK